MPVFILYFKYVCRMERYIWEDKEFGSVILHVRATARHFIFRVKDGKIEVTIPPFAKAHDISEVIDRNRPKLSAMMSKANETKVVFDEGDIIVTRDFTVVFNYVPSSKVIFQLRDKCLTIGCPSAIDMTCPEIQAVMIRGLKMFVKRSAEVYLPLRVKELSESLNLKYNTISVTFGRKRLGRCDTRKNIALSYYLMFLPDRLIDYVIFHELAHLTEMNHGESFHNLCNLYCGGEERSLRKELRLFRFPID